MTRRTDAAQRREAHLDDARELLDTGIAELTSEHGWRHWLLGAANLHRYSFRNQLLLVQQTDGQVSHVEGYRAWAALGRQVRKGEKGLMILAPVLRRPDTDETTTVDSQQSDAAASGPRRLVGVKPTFVFDITQTDGPPLPEPPRLLDGEAPAGLWPRLETLITDHGFTLRYGGVDELGPANGMTMSASREVVIRDDLSDAQAVKTLAHELGHVLLHTSPTDRQAVTCRGMAEVEAESVAFTVTATHGLPSDHYSFAYIAGWAAETHDPAAAITDTAQRVRAAADTILTATLVEEPVEPELLHDIAERGLRDLTALRDHAETAATTPAVNNVAAAPISHTHTAALTAAQEWFLDQAEASPQWAAAVAERGLTVEQARDLGIGWAPPEWDSLVRHLVAAGHDVDAIIDSGLARHSKRGTPIDVFRSRLTFPYRTSPETATPFAFTGRIAGPHTPNTPKYLNTASWDGFKKGEHVLGLDQRRDHTRALVLVEGPWDAAAVTATTNHEWVGVATNGTAFTRRQAQHLTDTGLPIIMWTDPDTPGIAAARNAYATLASLPDAQDVVGQARLLTTLGHDPSAYTANFGPDAVRTALTDATRPLLDAVIDHTIDRCNGQTAAGRIDTIRTITHLINKAPTDQRVAAISTLAARTNLMPTTVLDATAPILAPSSVPGCTRPELPTALRTPGRIA